MRNPSSSSTAALTRLVLVPLVPVLGIAACQVIDDVRYKPKIGALLPDARERTGLCPLIPGDTCGDSDLSTAVSFSRDIQPLFKRTTAAGCMTHAQMIAMPNVRFDMSTYASLRMGGVNSGAKIVVDCRPCESILVQKLADPVPPFGARMPMANSPWSDVEITLVRDWIAEGAQDN